MNHGVILVEEIRMYISKPYEIKTPRKSPGSAGRIVFICLAGTQAKISTNDLGNQGGPFVLHDHTLHMLHMVSSFQSKRYQDQFNHDQSTGQASFMDPYSDWLVG